MAGFVLLYESQYIVLSAHEAGRVYQQHLGMH